MAYVTGGSIGGAIGVERKKTKKTNKTNSLGLSSDQYNEDGSPKTVDMISNKEPKEEKKIEPIGNDMDSLMGDFQKQQEEYQKQVAEASKAKAIADLQNAYQTTNRNITEVEAGINPAYEDQRSGFRQQSTMQAKQFEDFLASKGLSASGTSGQGEIARNVALQGGLSSSQMAQQKALEDIDRQRQVAAQNLAFGTAQANSGIDLATLQANIESQKQLQQFQLAEAQRQNDPATLAQRASTLAQANYTDIQALINSLDPTDPLIPYLQAERQRKKSGIELGQSEAAQQAFENELLAREMALKEMETQYDLNKPYYKPSSGGSGGTGGSGSADEIRDDFQSFANEMYMMMNTDPAMAAANITENKEAIIAAIGKSGYNQLLKAARDQEAKLIDSRKLL